MVHRKVAVKAPEKQVKKFMYAKIIPLKHFKTDEKIYVCMISKNVSCLLKGISIQNTLKMKNPLEPIKQGTDSSK